MTPERARYILGHVRPGGDFPFAFRRRCDSSTALLFEDGITAEEDAYVKRVWERLPGWLTYSNVVRLLAECEIVGRVLTGAESKPGDFVFPWKAGVGLYGDEGSEGPDIPKNSPRLYDFAGHLIVLTFISESIITSRRQYLVECVTCNEVVHSRTNAPGGRAKDHVEGKERALWPKEPR